MEERSFTDAYGVEVLTRWWPVDRPLGVVLIAHRAADPAAAMGVHGWRDRRHLHRALSERVDPNLAEAHRG